MLDITYAKPDNFASCRFHLCWCV